MTVPQQSDAGTTNGDQTDLDEINRPLCVELAEQGLRFQRQVAIPVSYKGQIKGEHRLDLIVEGSVICRAGERRAGGARVRSANTNLSETLGQKSGASGQLQFTPFDQGYSALYSLLLISESSVSQWRNDDLACWI